MNDEPDDAERLGPQLSDELQRFAADLSCLRPRDDRLDRERLAFLAGRASVSAGSVGPTKVLGLPLESRAWPAAFAAMSAIAAVLFFALLMRSESSGLYQTATNDGAYRPPKPFSIEHPDVRDVLTTRDAHLSDIQSRIAKHDLDRADIHTSLPLRQDHDVPILTPNAWHQVINRTENSKPSSEDASSLFQIRGVTL
jgi:hypothetical protein